MSKAASSLPPGDQPNALWLSSWRQESFALFDAVSRATADPPHPYMRLAHCPFPPSYWRKRTLLLPPVNWRNHRQVLPPNLKVLPPNRRGASANTMAYLTFPLTFPLTARATVVAAPEAAAASAHSPEKRSTYARSATVLAVGPTGQTAHLAVTAQTTATSDNTESEHKREHR